MWERLALSTLGGLGAGAAWLLSTTLVLWLWVVDPSTASHPDDWRWWRGDD